MDISTKRLTRITIEPTGPVKPSRGLHDKERDNGLLFAHLRQHNKTTLWTRQFIADTRLPILRPILFLNVAGSDFYKTSFDCGYLWVPKPWVHLHSCWSSDGRDEVQ